MEVLLAMVSIHLTINDQAHSLDIDPRQSLLDALRERRDLTGTKKGCNQGACGGVRHGDLKARAMSTLSYG